MTAPRESSPPALPPQPHSGLLRLLAELDAVLAESAAAGHAYLLFAVGGFVMGSGTSSRLTQDIDIATTIPAPVAAAAAEVARRRGINAAWLNDQVSEMIDVAVPVERFNELFRGRHLVVYGADDELMLALKLMSGRPRDVPDIADLAARTGRTSAEALLDVWDRTYSEAPGAAHRRHSVASTVSEDVLSELRRRALSGSAEPPYMSDYPNNRTHRMRRRLRPSPDAAMLGKELPQPPEESPGRPAFVRGGIDRLGLRAGDGRRTGPR